MLALSLGAATFSAMPVHLEYSDGDTATIDLKAAQAALGIPFEIPLYPMPDSARPSDAPAGLIVLACFSPEPFGIFFDPNAVDQYGAEPNVTLLHECVHAFQWLREVTAGAEFDPERWPAMVSAGLAAHGYERAPHELEANVIARGLDAAGVRVWLLPATD